MAMRPPYRTAPEENAAADRDALDLRHRCLDVLDVHRRLLSVVDPCRHPWRRSCAMGLTSDALRPRSDAGRGRRSGDEEDAARPRVNLREPTRGAAATRGVKKTQLGPESTQRNGLRGSCYEVGENRPACRSTTGRPGERRSETRELRR